MSKRDEREIIAMNLKELLRAKKKTAKQVAEDLKVSYSTFGDWTRARTSPSASQLKDVANYFGTTIGNLTTLASDFMSNTTDAEILDSKMRIQILEDMGIEPDESSFKTITCEYVPRTLPGVDDSIGYTLKDDSMEPEYHKGDIVIARRVKYLNTDGGDYILDEGIENEWLPILRFARVYRCDGGVIITPLKINNEKGYLPEKLTEAEYLKKYRAKYSIIRLIRDYDKIK